MRVFSGGYVTDFLRGQGIRADDLVKDATPRVTDLEMSRVALWYVRSWLAQRRNVRGAAPLLASFRPDVVVGDEEFSGLTAAEGSGVPRVLVSDELSLGFARGFLAKKIEARVERWYAGLQKGVDLLILPEEGDDEGNRRYVGPIVRRPTLSGEETRRRHGLPDGRLLLVSLSGSGLGSELAEAASRAADLPGMEDVTVVIAGNRGPRVTGSRVVDLGVVPDNQNLVACADLVLSTAGKSTIDEAAAWGTPMVALPIRHHAEQERNAKSLGFTSDDRARIPEIVKQMIGKRSAPAPSGGETRAASLILGLAGGA